MNMIECDKFVLLAALESQQAILLYAKEEYERLLNNLEDSESETATGVLAAIDQNYACLKALVERVCEQYDMIASEGEKICDLGYDNHINHICEGEDGGCVCQRQITEFTVNSNPVPNIWASQ